VSTVPISCLLVLPRSIAEVVAFANDGQAERSQATTVAQL
jgi:hypothetical protein